MTPGCFAERLSRTRASAVAAGRPAGADGFRDRLPGSVIRRRSTEEVRPVPIFKAWAGMAQAAFRAVASFTVSSKSLFKGLGGSSERDTHDKGTDEQRDSHGALHVD